MRFNDYQNEIKKSAIYPVVGENFIYPLLGLVGETGEVAEKIKKIIRDNDGKISGEMKEEIEKELGDVLWYFSQLATELDLSLGSIAEKNIEKVKSRRERGVAHGKGDNR